MAGFNPRDMNNKVYSSIQRDAAIDWVDKWFELSIQIIDVTCIDDPPYSPPLLTDLEEINYQRLRFWLKEHENQFVPLWQDFYACQDWVVKDNILEDDVLFKNPLSCLYAPENLYRLAEELGLQSGMDVWEPSKHQSNVDNSLIIYMGKRMVEFVDWLDERVKV